MNRTLCRHLRTKKLYTGMAPERAFGPKEPEQATPSHFWCNLTQTVVGADDLPVHPERCCAGRSCWEE
ncbi:MAG TPA: hypothetical protein VF607_05440 [Verrucomicrobiae bacterium]